MNDDKPTPPAAEADAVRSCQCCVANDGTYFIERSAYERVVAELAKYKRWEANRAEGYASLRARQDPKCYGPDELLTTWEDNKVHCWECEWMKERARSAKLVSALESMSDVCCDVELRSIARDAIAEWEGSK